MFGKTLIDLNNTVFEFKTVVGDLPRCKFVLKGKTEKECKPREFTDFGSVFLIDPQVVDLLTPEDIEFIAEDHKPLEKKKLEDSDDFELVELPSGPHFKAPHTWRMPQVLKALGAFKSSTAAAKNGWDLDIEEGFSQFQIRINNIKGVITLHKITSENGIFNPNHWVKNKDE